MKLTEQQNEFLKLVIIEQKSFQFASEQLNLPRTTIANWYEELRSERQFIAALRTLWLRKKIKSTFLSFYQWYVSIEKKCHYCKITEEEIKVLLDHGLLKTKRIATRGRRLEVDRKQSELEYSDLENLTLCCYWCNNAKTDSFSSEEFKRVGAAIGVVWRERLAKL